MWDLVKAELIDPATRAPLSMNGPVQIFEGYSSAVITTKTTTVVKASPGKTGYLVVGTAGSADTIDFYDNTAASGTQPLPTFTGLPVGVYKIPVVFGVGITVVTGGTTAGKYAILFI